MRRIQALFALLALAACSGGDDTTATTAAATSSSSGGDDPCAKAVVPPPASEDWCDRVVAGPPGVRPVPVDLSAAHATARFFSPVADHATADQALVAAYASGAASDAPDLVAYAAALGQVACALPTASDAALPQASVVMEGNVAVVRPGAGAVAWPDDVSAVVIDLRGLPDAPGLREALEAAIAPALSVAVARPNESVRRHDGLTDEVIAAMNAYSHGVATIERAPIAPKGERELPMALLTEARMPGEAVEIAFALRLAARAWIIGEDVRAEAAEARWYGVGSAGVSVRHRDLIGATARWPDVIEADERTDRPECFAARITSVGAPHPTAVTAAKRPQVMEIDAFDAQQPVAAGPGEARAALIAAHGAARLFFPYFAVVGDTIDERLEETLAALGDSPDRGAIADGLRRFGHALTDGHSFVHDHAETATGCIPVYIEDIGGEAVVRRSLATGILPGDTITKIDGVAAGPWYATELARTSAATDGYRFNIATRRYLFGDAPIELELRDPVGALRTLTFERQPIEDFGALGYAPTLRAAGFLGDLGAPDLYYVNMASEVLTTDQAFRDALTAASAAKGLVIDMRGYPGIDHYGAARRLVQQGFSSPIFRVPVRTGIDDVGIDEEAYPFQPLANPSFAGPVALLVGHGSVSAAENFATMLVDAGRVKVIGRRSAGTNGNITGAQLPGSFALTFTGMEVLHADAAKSVFHGVGIAPDDGDVAMSAADFAAGKDPELEAAVVYLDAL